MTSFRKWFIAGLVLGTSATICSAAPNPEPDIEAALKWWPVQRNVWTPIGWKDHLFRFNVMYNGSVLVSPMGGFDRKFLEPYANDNLQLTFTPGGNAAVPGLPAAPAKWYTLDGGVGQQGWVESSETPILWTEWPRQDGVTIRAEMFAHLRGGDDVETALEPLYCWVRLSVAHVDPLRAPDQYTVTTQLSRLYTSNIYPFALDDSVTLQAFPDKAAFDQPLKYSEVREGATTAGLITLNDSRARAIIKAGDTTSISFTEAKDKRLYNLSVTLPSKVGAHADILVPFIPEQPDELISELLRGRESVLAETDDYWNQKPVTAARIHVPEPYINQAIRRNLQFAEIIADRNPIAGDYTFLSGSYGYDALWSTPTSMVSHMFLDLLGYHDVVDRHIDIIRKYQGSVKAPGDAYTTHPGYLATPEFLRTFDWLADHGANLEAAARHALLSGDKAFIEKWTTPTVAACEFLVASCKIDAPGGVSGLLPPAAATDTSVPSVAVWNQAWNYKGLMTGIQFLELVNHPKAAEFRSFAAQFKERFNDVFAEKVSKAPKWTGPDGKQHPVLPTDLVPAPAHHIFDDAFLLDTGPLVLPFAGLMDAADPQMKSFAEFFRVGPNTQLWGPRSSPIARAVLHHELSSCEPCYSWNIVSSALSGDRAKFLEGMYSLFAGAIFTQTYINCEHRNAMYGTMFVAPLMTWSLRQSVIDDQTSPTELHLLRLVPLAWISEKEETKFENMPTIFGPVDLNFKLVMMGESLVLDVRFSGKWRGAKPPVKLHIPPYPGLTGLRINGQDQSFESESEIIVSN